MLALVVVVASMLDAGRGKSHFEHMALSMLELEG